MPQKIKGVRYDKGSNSQSWKEGYNQACDDWLAYMGKREAELKQAQELYLKLSNDFANQEKEIMKWKEKASVEKLEEIIKSSELNADARAWQIEAYSDKFGKIDYEKGEIHSSRTTRNLAQTLSKSLEVEE